MYRCRVARARVRAAVNEVFMQLVDESSGYPYYYNVRTGESQWTKPLSRLMGGQDVVATSREAAPSTARPPVTARGVSSVSDAALASSRSGVAAARDQRQAAIKIQVRLYCCSACVML